MSFTLHLTGLSADEQSKWQPRTNSTVYHRDWANIDPLQVHTCKWNAFHTAVIKHTTAAPLIANVTSFSHKVKLCLCAVSVAHTCSLCAWTWRAAFPLCRPFHLHFVRWTRSVPGTFIRHTQEPWQTARFNANAMQWQIWAEDLPLYKGHTTPLRREVDKCTNETKWRLKDKLLNSV